MYKYFS